MKWALALIGATTCICTWWLAREIRRQRELEAHGIGLPGPGLRDPSWVSQARLEDLMEEIP